jgi:alpha-glucoside transport system substrate-binding protein
MKKLFLMSAAAAALALGSAHAADLKFTPGEGDFNWESYEALKATQLDGEEVTVFGPWLGPDQENVEAVLAYFAEATGADVKLCRLRQLRAADRDRCRSRLGAQHRGLPAAGPRRRHGQRAASSRRCRKAPPTGSGKTTPPGSPGSISAPMPVKDGNDNLLRLLLQGRCEVAGLVRPGELRGCRLRDPETMEELKALTEQIVADGETPWCIGLGSGGATGWPATDWVEDMMLRTQPPDVYDKWVSNEIRSPIPRRRRDRGIRLVRPQRHLLPAVPARSRPPTSATARRASSPRRRSATCTARRRSSRPSSRKAPRSVSTRTSSTSPPMPSKDLGKPVLGGGTLWAITNDSPGAQALIEFLNADRA